MTPLLTAAMIVRNEQHNLSECLASIDGIVDEIVIVDTGSEDDTVAIALEHGAHVFSEPWEDDFSRARNAALDRATGSWVLSLDADERLEPTTRDHVVDLLGSTDHLAYRVRLRPFTDATAYLEYRLWRNDPRLRFEGVIHERVSPSIYALAAREGGEIGRCDLTLRHLGYDGDLTRKHRRNIPLLRVQLRHEPNSVFGWLHLAQAYYGVADDAEGDAALERALEELRSVERPLPIGALVYADAIKRWRGTPDAPVLLDEGLSRYPDDPLLRWAKAADEIDNGTHRAALPWLDRLLDDPSPGSDDLSYDRRLFGAWAHAARGLCLFTLGDYAEASAAYRSAEELEPSSEEHRVKRLMAEHLDREQRRATAAWSRVVEVADVSLLVTTDDAAHGESLDEILGSLPPATTAPEVALTVRREMAFDEPESWPYIAGAVHARWDGDALLLRHGSVRGRVDESTGVIAAPQDVRRPLRQLLPYVLTHLLATRDRFVLHCGAIARDDEAVLLLGGSRAGKSTLAVSSVQSGWQALSDDLSVVRLNGSRVEVRGVPKPVFVPAEVARRSGLPHEPVPDDPRNRSVVDVLSRTDRWHPVTATILSSRNQSGEELRPLTGEELFQWLLFSFLATDDESRFARYRPVAAALTRIGGGVIMHGPHTTTPGALIDKLLSEKLRPR